MSEAIQERAYQSRMIEAIRASVARGNRRVLAVLPTGGGKGLIAAKVMESASLKGNPSAFFASQRELVYQIGAQLGKLNLPARTIMAGVKDEFNSFEEMNGADCYIIAKDTLWARAFKSDKVVAPPARVVQVDECLTGDSVVQTLTGEKRLDRVRLGDHVMSWDGSSVVFQKVTDFMDQGCRDIIIVRTSTSEIRCTANHPVLTKRGWVKAGSLETTDSLLIAGVDAEPGSTGTQQGECRSSCQDTAEGSLPNSGSGISRFTWTMRRYADAVVGFRSSLPTTRWQDSLQVGGLASTPGTTGSTLQGSLTAASSLKIAKSVCWLLLCMAMGAFACLTRSRFPITWCFGTDRSRRTGLNGRSRSLLPFHSMSGLRQMEAMATSSSRRVRLRCHNSTSLPTSACKTEGRSLPRQGWIAFATSALRGFSATTDRRPGHQEGSTLRGLTRRPRSCLLSGSVSDTDQRTSMNTEDTDTSTSQTPHSLECAEGFGNSSPQSCSTRWESIVSMFSGTRERVYDISVEGTHCFFANRVLVHNCHGALAPTYQKILASYPDSVIIGWTATPCRSDGKPLGTVFDDMVIGATYRELQEQGYLVPVKVVAPDRPDLKGLKVSRGDYAKGALEKRMNRDEMVGNIVKEWMTHAEGRSTVLFAAGVDHSVHCRDMFRKEGITAEHLDGKMPTPERDDILGRVRDGKVMVLCNYGVAHTGTDVPRWKVMVCARPTKSFGLWRQMGGRIQRPYPGHSECLIVDHSDNALHFGFPDEDVEWDLNGDEDQGKKHMEKKRKSEDGKPAKDPYACDKCKTMYRGYACPTCGHKPDRKSEAVKMTKGELKELERQKANKAATPMDKQKFWDECLGWSIGNKKKVGAAAHRYRERFGVFPNSSIQNVPRSSQWQMTGKQFYDSVVKPAKQAAQPEYQDSLPW